MIIYSYRAGDEDIDRIRDLTGDNQMDSMVFSDNLIVRLVDEGLEDDEIVARLYEWLAGNNEALKRRFGLPRIAGTSDIEQAAQRALQLADRARQEKDFELDTYEDDFDRIEYLQDLRDEEVF